MWLYSQSVKARKKNGKESNGLKSMRKVVWKEYLSINTWISDFFPLAKSIKFNLSQRSTNIEWNLWSVTFFRLLKWEDCVFSPKKMHVKSNRTFEHGSKWSRMLWNVRHNIASLERSNFCHFSLLLCSFVFGASRNMTLLVHSVFLSSIFFDTLHSHRLHFTILFFSCFSYCTCKTISGLEIRAIFRRHFYSQKRKTHQQIVFHRHKTQIAFLSGDF